MEQQYVSHKHPIGIRALRRYENHRKGDVATEDVIKSHGTFKFVTTARGEAGDIYRHWREKGFTITSIDCLIAATAALKKHKIATRDKGHYPEKGLLLGQLLTHVTNQK